MFTRVLRTLLLQLMSRRSSLLGWRQCWRPPKGYRWRGGERREGTAEWRGKSWPPWTSPTYRVATTNLAGFPVPSRGPVLVLQINEKVHPSPSRCNSVPENVVSTDSASSCCSVSLSPFFVEHLLELLVRHELLEWYMGEIYDCTSEMPTLCPSRIAMLKLASMSPESILVCSSVCTSCFVVHLSSNPMG